MSVTIYARRDNQYYRLTVSRRWAEANDNGALISCGLTVCRDITEGQLRALIRRKQAVEVSEAQWRHGGCQSQCILRGDATCRW